MKTLREVLTAIILVSFALTVISSLVTIIWILNVNLFIKIPLTVLVVALAIYLPLVWRDLITKK